MAGSVARVARNNEEAKRFVEASYAQGVDLVKLMITGGVLDAKEKGVPGEMKMPEDFLLKISKLGSNFDSVADTVLQAGGEVVLKRVKSNLSSVIGRGTKFKSRTTGELEGALGLSPSKLNRDGNHDIKVGFAEPRSDGGSNAKLANILEYGKHGQPAKPFLKPAKMASRQECIDAMTKALDEEVEKL